MDKSSNSQPFVIIAGGGISGLTLANALEKAGVEYVLLESHDTVAPNVGASIAIHPNGGRILDQLGCYDRVLDETFSMSTVRFVDQKGETFLYSNGFELLEKRFSYRSSFLERRMLLQILYDNLKDKSRIKMLKRIVRVDHSETGVSVACQDGTEIHGDVLIGCDGVNSLVRQEMWRLADLHDPEAIKHADKGYLGAEFQCIFGISTVHNLVAPGEMDFTVGKGTSSVVVAGKRGQTFWFVAEKMPKYYQAPGIPKFSQNDLQEFAQSKMDFVMKNGVPFRDLWHTRTNATLTVTEEGELKRWSWGRLACAGDSIHKMTPHMGTGGNAAIETVAALANELVKLKDLAQDGKLDHSTIQAHLARYQETHRRRANALWSAAYELARIVSLDSIVYKVLLFWLSPLSKDFIIDELSNAFTGATKLEYLPDPGRSLKGTMGFNPVQGIGNQESKVRRAMLALPLLFMAMLPLKSYWPFSLVQEMDLSSGIQYLFSLFSLSLNGTGLGEGVTYPVLKISSLIGQRLAFDVTSISCLTDIGIYYAIMLFESAKRANHLTLVSMPLLILSMQSFSIVGVLGVYCFIHYVQTPVEKLQAKDMRLTNRAYSRSVLATLVLAFYLPVYCSSCIFLGEEARGFWDKVGQYFPLWVSLLQYGLRSAMFGETMDQDKVENPSRDLPVIDRTIFVLSFISAVVRSCDIIGITGLFSKSLCNAFALEHVSSWLGMSSQSADASCFVILFIWLVYLFSDIKSAGMMQQNLWVVASFGVITWLLLGPGVAIGLGWLLREHILANRIHKANTAYGKTV